MPLSPFPMRPLPETSILKKGDPAPPPLDPRAFPRLSPSQLPENAVDDDEDEDMLPPASMIAILPIKSRPGNMRLPRYPKNLNSIVHDQWQRAPTQPFNRPPNPNQKHLQRRLPEETGLQNDSAAGEGNAVGRLLRSQSDTTVFGSNPGNNPISNIRSSSQQTLMEYDADKPLLRVVGFEYSPNPQARSSLVVAASPSGSDQQRDCRRIELHTLTYDPNRGNPNVVLFGYDIFRLYEELPEPVYLYLCIDDYEGESLFTQSQIFDSLKQHTYQPETREIYINDGDITILLENPYRAEGRKDRRAAEVASFAKLIVDKAGVKFSRSPTEDSIIGKVLGM
ncbi:uncharacterized protein PgNI_02734 [Pyricularia grisea]|uniref:Uncharacterized protein n=1 Tax=Pyricularia grisea TaxID=148305 RepID=A0A6P8BCK8_PYRGI|nr:uncharacterized protein PgNI_02734 [Pyricularia grisea]TLD13533.1 hypothetical protein PgNI_02734 [Pyricularia grisea]